eukprot:CAMPEP_0183444432 /NCGR_PEP_ID=MMETSP0370-20130417/95028_1 /TAXON_ID=268820 /ORGANISM="Peridinium aciculiferum, Strain PAER-2" /LENGTH=55 /DNA_ID=CAMNT_0025634781 /DNA_START=59 /DNA_END=223 /DNA_ORIENTATION=+
MMKDDVKCGEALNLQPNYASSRPSRRRAQVRQAPPFCARMTHHIYQGSPVVRLKS